MTGKHLKSNPFTSYVCGFMFDKKRQHVLLIKKIKPEWQRGKFNGIGGKVEEGETPAQAMHRESVEETSTAFQWEPTIKLSNMHFQVHFFRAFVPMSVLTGLNNQKVEGEGHLKVHHVLTECRHVYWLPSLHWLIPMHACKWTFDEGDQINSFDRSFSLGGVVSHVAADPVILAEGEYWVPPEVEKRYGPKLLNALNRGIFDRKGLRGLMFRKIKALFPEGRHDHYKKP